ncbi:MAG: hypothetical protein IT513_03025 [Burkholderiales bacterium]|nr:hypothetical protein [Burkholderiales bacterium]
MGGSFLLRKIARPEALDTSLALVWILMCAVVVAAFAWGSQLETGSGPTLAGWEQRYCGEDAGESIYRSVENINGVFYLAPALGARHGHFHTDDGRAEKFLRRPDRRYDFLEVRMAADRLVERHELKDGKIASTRTDVPTARYAFTWTPLESMEEANAGIYGEELEVFDRETREVLGRRVLYYRDPSRRGTAAYGAPMPVCPQGILATDPTYIDGQPRDSYDFVSRVLKPVALTAEENAKFFDLRRGGGRRSKQCVGGYVWIGEGIEPKDLSFARQGKDLTITISDGSGDELRCQDYFFSETGGSRSYRLRFAGRALISEEELRLRLASKDAAK